MRIFTENVMKCHLAILTILFLLSAHVGAAAISNIFILFPNYVKCVRSH